MGLFAFTHVILRKYYKFKKKKREKKLKSESCVFVAVSFLRYGIRPENVIVYGQSIGTVPSVDLAARYESAAVILHSPLTSGMRVAFPDTKKTYCFDAFPKYVLPFRSSLLRLKAVSNLSFYIYKIYILIIIVLVCKAS